MANTLEWAVACGCHNEKRRACSHRPAFAKATARQAVTVSSRGNFSCRGDLKRSALTHSALVLKANLMRLPRPSPSQAQGLLLAKTLLLNAYSMKQPSHEIIEEHARLETIYCRLSAKKT